MVKSGMFCDFLICGGFSFLPLRFDFEAKYLLNISLFWLESWIISSFSFRGEIPENVLFFINRNKILHFFLADIEWLFIVELTEL